ncbi:phosphomethylpyrimidine kinase [Methanomicrobiaceae archaeon CYW5]|uniref:thiamine-phosphate synthase family protein n=1 Tax=Methanovulcanius yangii TaxID=1789227 RepID=UPI0029C9F8E4|nr:thiamine-phosphate synthase family protein [Methanovulcanius yangii]MBT8507704.1 phosphomethylpyrimidine kinase [Methanovulcanius yangii]
MSAEERAAVLHDLENAVRTICSSMDVSLVPEVGLNIVFALPNATDSADVAGVEGRIVRLRGHPHAVGEVAFGASSHVARVVLTALRHDPEIRSAANIRFSEGAVAIAEDMKFDICSFDRTSEPPGTRTMDWGVEQCCTDEVPDVIYDRGAVGKEPMIRILGEDPEVVVHNILMLSQRIIDTNE